jgi:hypothetical protein
LKHQYFKEKTIMSKHFTFSEYAKNPKEVGQKAGKGMPIRITRKDAVEVIADANGINCNPAVMSVLKKAAHSFYQGKSFHLDAKTLRLLQKDQDDDIIDGVTAYVEPITVGAFVGILLLAFGAGLVAGGAMGSVTDEPSSAGVEPDGEGGVEVTPEK